MIKKFKFRNTRMYTFFLCLKFNIRMKIGECLSIIKKTGNYKYDFDKNEWVKKEILFNLNDNIDKKENKTKRYLPIK